ncbi:MAG: helix-turn-helix domain-containing protein [Propionibacteriales bacterium]|nr:helix-turn-helix domain-containing protein [Propionibacteriales bacterium]
MRADRKVFSIRRWPGMRSEYSWLPPDDTETATRPYQIGVSFSAHTKVAYGLGDVTRHLAIPAGAVFANGPHEVRWSEVGEPTEAMEIYPDLNLLHAAVEPSQSGLPEIETVTAARDATILGLAARLRQAHVAGVDLDAMQASSLAHRLIAHLADHYCRPRPRRNARTGAGGLDRVLVDRVAGLVEDRLGERLVLTDLADEAGLSPYHFARSFKISTGMAPHEFVTMRRMERAKRLLLTTCGSVPEVAYAVGYSNVRHFRRLLSRHTGFAPSDLRPGRPPNRPSQQDPTLR